MSAATEAIARAVSRTASRPLTDRQRTVLEALARNGPMTPQELKRALGSPEDATRLRVVLEALAARGAVRLVPARLIRNRRWEVQP